MKKTIGQSFIEATILSQLRLSNREKGLKKPPLEWGNCGEDFIDLPHQFNSFNSIDVLEAIEARESIREYKYEALSIEELSYLLWCTQGVKRVIPHIVTLRNVPSAGGCHAFETFLLINHVQGLTKGVYRYLASTHQLFKVCDINEEIWIDAFDEQLHSLQNNVTFIWVAIKERMTFSYGERGYRYLFIDAGHVCQNLYLASTKITCGTCALAHFHDEKINKLLKLDGIKQFVVYSASVGKL